MAAILGIESSCDDTAAAVFANGKVLSNIISSQLRHADFGGVVPELASRMHQQAIGVVVKQALTAAGITPQQLAGVAFTSGPGLLGSLLVGGCFAKGYALGLGIPLLEVNHLQGHIASLLLAAPAAEPPFICLTVSGGHTRLQLVHSSLDYELIGSTRDDAAGEAFDKAAKLMGLPYPGGPAVDALAKQGNPNRFTLPIPAVAGYDFSFSGLKTALLYLVQREQALDPDFLEHSRADLCASLQHTLVRALLDKLFTAARAYKINSVGIAGGVAANSELRSRFLQGCAELGLQGNIPPHEYCTDNAAMIALVGHLKYELGQFAPSTTASFAS